MDTVRRAGEADAPAAGRLLHDFNAEFEEYTPPPEVVAVRVSELLAQGAIAVLLAGEGPDGIAVISKRPALFSGGGVALLEELYVAPALRGAGLGRALLQAAMEVAREMGAGSIELNTGETDRAARGLYEATGFTNREGTPDGPRMLFYEREL